MENIFLCCMRFPRGLLSALLRASSAILLNRILSLGAYLVPRLRARKWLHTVRHKLLWNRTAESHQVKSLIVCVCVYVCDIQAGVNMLV